MKKLLVWYGIPALISLALIIGGIEIREPIICLIGLAFLVLIPFMISHYLRKRMEKRALELEKKFSLKGFSYQYKFISHSGIFYIDANGRMGVVRKYNPSELELIDLTKITDIRTNDGKMLGGTSLVSCSFKLEGKTQKIYTLRVSNAQLSMKSHEVLEAISKADALCESLEKARKAALKSVSNLGGIK